MSGNFNNLFIVLVITSPLCPRVCSRFLPMKSTPSVSLLSWEEGYPMSAPSIPDRCLKAGLCTNADNYPTELVSKLLIRLSEKNITKFTRDQLYENEYSNDVGEILELCETKKEKIVFPRAAKDQNGEWQFILNMPGHPFQSFRVHECLDVEKVSCSAAVYPTDMVNYGLQCEQQFTKREMVYLNLEKKVVSTGQFLVPSCCSCFLEPR